MARNRLLVWALVIGAGTAAASEVPPAPTEPQTDLALAAASHTDTGSLSDAVQDPIPLGRDGQDAQLRSFTIEGEDRVSIKFDRPGINLDLDPRQAPGLGWENAWDKVDVLPAVTGQTAMGPARYAGQPWRDEYAQDQVVVFHPQAPEMASWQLTVVDSRGKPALVRLGEGAPPANLAWNGRRDDGQPAWPGLIYSFVMETVDPAGNPRTFSGRGFGLPSYRLTGPDEDVLVFAGDQITGPDLVTPLPQPAVEPLMAETASWLNQAPGGTSPIEIRVLARKQNQAQHLADLVRQALAGRVCGAPDRITTVALVVDDAPDQGVIQIASQPGS